MNPVTGEKLVDINGKQYVLKFTWAALAEIEVKFGENPNLFKPEVLAAVAAAGLRHKHPDMTADRLIDTSPPIVPFAQAVQEAIRWACFGNEKPPEITPEKKSLPLVGGLRNLIKRLLRRE